ncbi:MAG: tetratricopeptide repeat protein [Candidatus Pacebacteria bacterium]|nr:tetratricopeptide repeat protein [Candidatus Paceibacterota bacterium]
MSIPHRVLGDTYRLLGRLEESREQYEKALEIFSGDSFARAGLELLD